MSAIGQTEDIDHGTGRGYRQHKRRHVVMCDPCQIAHDAEQDDDGDRAEAHAWNGGRGGKLASSTSATARTLSPQEKRAGARQLAGRAVDAAEAAELLAMAGLTAADGLADVEAP